MAAQALARELGVAWAGGSDQAAPALLDAAILFAPVGDLVPAALKVVRKGGRVVCGGIHMSDIPGFAYRLLWGERELVSVANLTRQDGSAMERLLASQMSQGPLIEQQPSGSGRAIFVPAQDLAPQPTPKLRGMHKPKAQTEGQIPDAQPPPDFWRSQRSWMPPHSPQALS
mgnify:CR=1 FL=1